MRIILSFVAAAIVFSAAPAQAQDHADLVSMSFLQGKCTRLIIPDGDRTKDCNTALGLVSYSNGRHSFWFSIPNSSLIAFSGMDEEQYGDDSILRLDLVSFASDPAAVHSGAGAGSCSFSDPTKGPAHIRCEGTSEAGKFVAEFVSDGKPAENLVHK